ncbi:putative MFS family arabinose efflux permease [Providencia alcalifaciens]|nr:putative MFS family arabinose efflux permease [Providencia alcalifaciens]
MNQNLKSKNNVPLPISALLALAMTGFICIVTETLPAGLLFQISSSLNVESSFAGQTITVYALGSLIAAIPLTIATQSWRRRTVLLCTIVGFLLFNTLTALSSFYWLTLVARFFAGVSAGLAWSLLAGYARRMVQPHQQGKAMAIAMIGTPIALSLGVPLGAWLGGLVGWRSAFGVMSALSVILIIWVIIKVPNYSGQSKEQQISLKNVLRTPGVKPVLCTVIAWMLAHNLLYTYIAPFVELAGLLNDVDLVLLVFGIAALIGIGVVSRLVDSYLRVSVLVSLVVFGGVIAVFSLFADIPIIIYLGVAIWGGTFGGAATLLQTALADTAGDGADVALSMNVVAWNSAIAGGGIVGGILLDVWGVQSFLLVMFLVLMVGFIIAWSAKKHGFVPEPRFSK